MKGYIWTYKVEMAAKTIKSVKLSNFTEIYSLTNKKKYDIDNLTLSSIMF